MTVGTLVFLTDGEPTLAHYMDQMRAGGWRVLGAARAVEALQLIERERPRAVIARSHLLPPDAAEWAQRARAARHDMVLVLTGTALAPVGVDDAVFLHEPFRFSTLVDAVCAPGSAVVLPRAASSSPTAPDRLVSLASRLVACAHRLTSLERDREQLITAALEMFVEVTEAERGSLLLATPDFQLAVAGRHGFETPDPDVPAPAEQFAPEVARDQCPRIAFDTVADPARGSIARSCLVLPLVNDGTLLGVVALSDRRGGRHFGEADLEAASLLARQVVANLENSAQLVDLQRLAVVDPLTGLFNRRFFDRQLAIELERARRYGRQVTLALIDIDAFKLFNDRHGYGTGDAVIRHVADAIRGNFREVDIVTRWGGDEFAVILPETGKPRSASPGRPATLNYVERVRSVVEKIDFASRIPGISTGVTISAGLATFPGDCADGATLFQRANQALLRAKRAGHNRVCIAETEPSN